jgi:hypothetical protein
MRYLIIDTEKALRVWDEDGSTLAQEVSFPDKVALGSSRLATLDEVAQRDFLDSVYAQAEAESILRANEDLLRTELQSAVDLYSLYPAPTPEETVIIDQQVTAALSAFRDLDNPPADIVALAAAVTSWRAEI